MAYANTYSVTLETDSSGAATGYTSVIPYGKIINVIYTKDDFSDGVDFTITTETTTQNIWVDTNINASETVAPRQAITDTSGDALYYNTALASPAETYPVTDYIYCVNERIKVVIASGGAAKSGTFTFIVA